MQKRYTFIIAMFLANSAMSQFNWLNPLPQGNYLQSVCFPDPIHGYAAGGVYLVKLVGMKGVKVGKFMKL
jgi:hypothetical protein